MDEWNIYQSQNLDKKEQIAGTGVFCKVGYIERWYINESTIVEPD